MLKRLVVEIHREREGRGGKDTKDPNVCVVVVVVLDERETETHFFSTGRVDSIGYGEKGLGMVVL